jgi:hypothetical protein
MAEEMERYEELSYEDLGDDTIFAERLDTEPTSAEYVDEAKDDMAASQVDLDFRESIDSDAAGDQLENEPDSLGDKLKQAYNDFKDDTTG